MKNAHDFGRKKGIRNMDIAKYNSIAWDKEVKGKNKWKQNNQLVVRNRIPYADIEHLPKEQLEGSLKIR